MNHIPAFVRESHQEFQSAAVSRVPSICPLVTKLHHPMAPFCARMEDFFNQLQFDAGARFRFYSALDKHNFSMFSRPGIYRAGTRRGLPLQQLIGRAASAADRYRLVPGEMHFYTSDQDLLHKVAVALGARTVPYNSDDDICFMAFKPICNETDLRTAREIIHLYHAGHVLPSSEPGREDATGVPAGLLRATQSATAAPDAWL